MSEMQMRRDISSFPSTDKEKSTSKSNGDNPSNDPPIVSFMEQRGWNPHSPLGGCFVIMLLFVMVLLIGPIATTSACYLFFLWMLGHNAGMLHTAMIRVGLVCCVTMYLIFRNAGLWVAAVLLYLMLVQWIYKTRKEREQLMATPTPDRPLDGRWKETWYRQRLPSNARLEDCEHLIETTGHLCIVRNVIGHGTAMPWEVYDRAFELRYETVQLGFETDRIFFRWPSRGVTQTLEPECDFRRDMGDDVEDGQNIEELPGVGDCLRWTTDDPKHPYIVWQKEDVSDYAPVQSPLLGFSPRVNSNNSAPTS